MSEAPHGTVDEKTVDEKTLEASLAEALLAPDAPDPKAVKTARRFAVYRNNVAVGLIDALAATYPACLALVGEVFFRAAAREFALSHPPRSPILIEWGGDFPDWISAFPPAAGVPYLGDVARLEWAWNRAYNSAEAAPIDISELAAVSPERVSECRLQFHPSFTVVASNYPVVSLWAQTTERVPKTELDLSRPETALIVRPQDVVDVRQVDPGTAAFLQCLATGGTIAEAAEISGGAETELGERIAGLFKFGLAIGLVIDNAPTAKPTPQARSF
ncbi:MAG: DNA-binding domain-containing protein [Pseudomonadota bacterium]